MIKPIFDNITSGWYLTRDAGSRKNAGRITERYYAQRSIRNNHKTNNPTSVIVKGLSKKETVIYF